MLTKNDSEPAWGICTKFFSRTPSVCTSSRQRKRKLERKRGASRKNLTARGCNDHSGLTTTRVHACKMLFKQINANCLPKLNQSTQLPVHLPRSPQVQCMELLCLSGFLQSSVFYYFAPSKTFACWGKKAVPIHCIWKAEIPIKHNKKQKHNKTIYRYLQLMRLFQHGESTASTALGHIILLWSVTGNASST